MPTTKSIISSDEESDFSVVKDVPSKARPVELFEPTWLTRCQKMRTMHGLGGAGVVDLEEAIESRTNPLPVIVIGYRNKFKGNSNTLVLQSLSPRRWWHWCCLSNHHWNGFRSFEVHVLQSRVPQQGMSERSVAVGLVGF